MRLFHFTSDKHGRSAIADQRLKVATIGDLNDPFELLCHDLKNTDARRAFSAFKAILGKHYGLLCFSKFWRNPLQWSHYADRHKGMVLAFDVDDDAIQKVRYVRSREPFDYRIVSAAGGFSQDDAARIFTTKSHHWSYEREYRVAIPLAECPEERGLRFADFSDRMKLRGVVLGALSKTGSDDIQKLLPAGLKVHVRKARLAFQTFSVVPLKTHGVRHVLGVA